MRVQGKHIDDALERDTHPKGENELLLGIVK